MIDGLRWIAANRNSLPGLIAEGEIPENCRPVASPFEQPEDVFIGSVASSDRHVPVLVVLKGESFREILAWLATYSPTSFPLSQSVRSMTADDLREREAAKTVGHSLSNNTYWPCVILGELLGQGEFHPALEGVAVSRAHACFSHAYARTQTIYGQGSSLAETCKRRLQTLESDKLFVKRAIKVDELKPIWDNVSFNRIPFSRANDLGASIANLLERDLVESMRSSSFGMNGVGIDLVALGSGAMESRVRSFEAFLESMRGKIDNNNTNSAAMLVAAAAIMVGNGTSHISLLEEFGKRIPAVFAWFGYFAAKVGPKGWDPAWNRAVNSVGRLTRGKFDLTDSPSFDLSWLEYDFVKGVARPSEFIRHIPKLYPRLLSIEVVPGASCQFRILDDAARVPSSVSNVSKPIEIHGESATTLQEVTRSLQDIEHRLGAMRSVVQKAIISIGVPEQSGLFEPATKKIFKRNRPAKKGPLER